MHKDVIDVQVSLRLRNEKKVLKNIQLMHKIQRQVRFGDSDVK